MNKKMVGVIGSGAMGAGIAQVAAMAGHTVVLYDNNEIAIEKAKINLENLFEKLQQKEKITSADEIMHRFIFTNNIETFSECSLIIEAIIEKLEIKKSVFATVEKIVSDDFMLATNTSSLSVTSIAAACQ